MNVKRVERAQKPHIFAMFLDLYLGRAEVVRVTAGMFLD